MKSIKHRKQRTSPEDMPGFSKSQDDEGTLELNLSNHFLIAMPSMLDPIFGGSVVYLCEHNAGGALGVIINKPTDMTLDVLLDRIDLTLEIASDGIPLDHKPVMLGGPVQVERGFVLHTPIGQFSSMMAVSDDIVLTTSKDVLEAVAHGTGPAHILVSLGCAGWGAGQLEQEIVRNGWLTVRADPRIVFDLPIEERFGAAMRLLGVDPMMLTGEAGHA
ncbi:MAG: YqgE/AlgH family protein [Burkholderiales bacterium]